MNDKQKAAIAAALQQYVGKYKSQNKAAQSLGISAGTLSFALSGKWDKLSDDMWRALESHVGMTTTEEWQIVQTAAHQEMNYVMDDAQKWKNVTWVVGDAGCGKTTAAKLYESMHSEAFYILCSEDMKRGDFIRDIAKRIGIKTDGFSLRDNLDNIIMALVQMESPLLIFDEADKLSERVFHYFIDLYNRLEDKCGIVFFSTSYIKRRIKMGKRYDKKGYNEIDSRIGRKFFDLEATTAHDVYAVCAANGVNDKARISDIIRDAESCDFDLRRVKKAVHRAKRMSE